MRARVAAAVEGWMRVEQHQHSRVATLAAVAAGQHQP